jgi:hypothetical protein
VASNHHLGTKKQIIYNIINVLLRLFTPNNTCPIMIQTAITSLVFNKMRIKSLLYNIVIIINKIHAHRLVSMVPFNCSILDHTTRLLASTTGNLLQDLSVGRWFI